MQNLGPRIFNANAKKIVLIACGENKAEAVKMLLSEQVTTDFPASALHNHNDVVVIVDDAAFMRMMIKDILTKNGYEIAAEAERSAGRIG